MDSIPEDNDSEVSEKPKSVFSSAWEKAAKTLEGAAQQVSAAGTKAVEITESGAGMTANAAKGAIEVGTQAVVTMQLDAIVRYVDVELDQRGVKEAVGKAAGAFSDKLDQVTGKQLVELLETKLRRQDEYNDILATRLAEALNRIAALEARVKNEH